MRRVGGGGGGGGYLAEAELRRHARPAAGVLMPVILFVALANGALHQQFIQDDANRARHVTRSADDKGVQTLSFLVVGMIALFAAVVVANIAVATTLHRRREFGQRRLIGDTPGEVRRSVGCEAAAILAAALVFGTLSPMSAPSWTRCAPSPPAVPPWTPRSSPRCRRAAPGTPGSAR